MAYYNSNRINSFADAELRYNTVKPMRGAWKDCDIRPLGERRQKYERIKKINDNCYVLLDWGYADDVFRTSWYSNGNAKPVVTVEEQIMLAPIVWRRHPDGTETVTVRNATDTGHANGRYKMLEWYLPRGLAFNVSRHAEHTIRSWHMDKTFYLNLSRTVPKQEYEGLKQSNYTYGIAKIAQVEDDGVALTFKRVGDAKFEYVSGGTPRMITRKRIKKEEKAPYVGALDNLFSYIITMRPLLAINDPDYQKRMRQEVDEWCEEQKMQNSRYWGGLLTKLRNDTAALRSVLNPEHPMFLHMAYEFMVDEMRSGMPETPEELKVLRNTFTRWANKTFDFIYEVYETYEK